MSFGIIIPLSGVRLTAEALHRSPLPTWRAVYEIGGALGDAADEVVHGSQLVEGQRLDEWLTGLIVGTAAPLDQARIDAVWRTIVMGIGRPDPLP